MPFVLGSMIVVSGIAGIALLAVAVKWAAARYGALSRSVTIEGAVIGVERKEVRATRSASGRRRRSIRPRPTRYAFHPRIAFTTPQGAQREFVAAGGKIAERSPYVIGSEVVVCFDPLEIAPPAVNTFAGLWGPAIAAGCGGSAFTAISIGLGFLFGAKVLGS